MSRAPAARAAEATRPASRRLCRTAEDKLKTLV